MTAAMGEFVIGLVVAIILTAAGMWMLVRNLKEGKS